MSYGVNRVMLMGNLGNNPETHVTRGGQVVLSMRLATTDSYLDKEGVRRDRTDWHSVVMFGKRAEALARILHKGSQIFVEGSLRTSSYEGRDGVKRQKTEIIANDLVMAGGGANDGGPRRQERPTYPNHEPAVEPPRRDMESEVDDDVALLFDGP